MYACDKTLSHVLRLDSLYHVYLFILNMQNPFLGLKAMVKAINRG